MVRGKHLLVGLCPIYQVKNFLLAAGSVMSDAAVLTYGLPQGSVIPPFYFLSVCYHHVFKLVTSYIAFQFYAHDTQLCLYAKHDDLSKLNNLKDCMDYRLDILITCFLTFLWK